MSEKSNIQQAIYYLLKENPFLGSLLQEINICPRTDIPTACLKYDKENARFEVNYNEEYFDKLTRKERIAVLFHEMLHFSHGHIFRFETFSTEKNHQLFNISADMAINQFISGLPEGVVNVKDWFQKDGSPFPELQNWEVYYNLLQQTTKDKSEGNGDGSEGSPEERQANGEKNAKGRKGQQANTEQFQKYKPMDIHEWGDMSEDDKRRLFEEAKKMVTRASEKAFKDYSQIPDAVKDLLEKIKTEIAKLDYKGLLKRAIKKTLTTQDRARTWNRPNKRYGVYAPGSTVEKAPFIHVYADTSGSISMRELNEFKACMDGFLKQGLKKCMFGMWHTALYYQDKYKINTDIKSTDVESGGTDVGCVLQDIDEKRPSLSIILTDGYFGKTKQPLTKNVVWIISKDGSVDHPYKDIGITVRLDGIKNNN